jgi:hypothetical protein
MSDHLTTQNTNRQIYMPPVGNEPTILAGEQSQNTLNCATTVTSTSITFNSIYWEEYLCLWLNIMCIFLCQNSNSDGLIFRSERIIGGSIWWCIKPKWRCTGLWETRTVLITVIMGEVCGLVGKRVQ